MLTAAADVYSFGLLMYEACTGTPPYDGLGPLDIINSVYAGLRPTFPAGTPPSYQALAQACWAQDSAQRPTIAAVLQQLQVCAAVCGQYVCVRGTLYRGGGLHVANAFVWAMYGWAQFSAT
jgi:serine/threonine protein kinase, bacterial